MLLGGCHARVVAEEALALLGGGAARVQALQEIVYLVFSFFHS